MFESLEGRRLLNASLNEKGTLVVIGTGGHDDIGVWQPNAATLQVVMNGVATSFANADVRDIHIDGGKGNDLIVIGAHVHDATLIGGRGNDSLSGGDGNDHLYGGPGDDYLFGRGGDDVIYQGAEPDGGDLILGGKGNDTVDYSARTGGVRVGIGVLTDDGARDEGDDVRADIETVLGGAGADRLSTTYPQLPVTFHGNGGNDTLIGSDRADRLYGGKGVDRIWNVGPGDYVHSKDGQRDIICGGTGFASFVKDKIDFLTLA